MGKFVRAILDDEIIPCGEAAKPGLAALLFSKDKISDYVFRQRWNQMGETYSAREAAKLLGVTKEVVHFLARKEILPHRSEADEGYPELLIGKDDLELFNYIYVLPAKVAAQLGTVSGYLTSLLIAQGIQPVSGPKTDGGRQYIFRRADLDGVDIAGIISNAKTQNSISYGLEPEKIRSSNTRFSG
jgi:hypothetical protein